MSQPNVSTEDCWLYASHTGQEGYGMIQNYYKGVKYPPIYPHRLFYEIYKGEIPEGLEIDHLCYVRHCINPDHLEAVTQLENLRRSRSRRLGVTSDQCPQGHEYLGENLIIENSTGYRRCRKCRREQEAKKRRKAMVR